MHKPGASSCKKLGWTIESSIVESHEGIWDVGEIDLPPQQGWSMGRGCASSTEKKSPLEIVFYAFWVVLAILLRFCTSLRNNRWQTGVLDMFTPWCDAPGAKCITPQCFWHPACLSVDLYMPCPPWAMPTAHDFLIWYADRPKTGKRRLVYWI